MQLDVFRHQPERAFVSYYFRQHKKPAIMIAYGPWLKRNLRRHGVSKTEPFFTREMTEMEYAIHRKSTRGVIYEYIIPEHMTDISEDEKAQGTDEQTIQQLIAKMKSLGIQCL